MNLSHCRHLWLALICVCLATGAARATIFLTLQSTYLGNGWFQYQMDVMNDPFFSEADITGLILPLENQIGQTAGANGWNYEGGGEWGFASTNPPRPFSETFLVHSSDTSYRLATNWDGATVLLSLMLTGMYPWSGDAVFSPNMVGYAVMPCLTPCSPAEADGSATNFVYNLKLVPDVTISQLIQTNGNVYGVDFAWGSPATFILQGSPDMTTWVNITHLWSYPPETIWTTNTPLNSYGQFFRLELVADGHQTGLAAHGLVAKAAVKPNLSSGVLRVTSCQVVGTNVAVSVAAQPGQSIQVEAINQHGDILQSQHKVALGSSVTANFDSGSFPSPVFFQAVATP